MPQIKYNNIHNNTETIFVPDPDRCPYCHKAATFDAIAAADQNVDEQNNTAQLVVLLRCPSKECGQLFSVLYDRESSGPWVAYYVVSRVFPPISRIVKISTDISNISARFGKIFQQATEAEDQGLTEICGMGYRKALEVLIKDYACTLCDTENEKNKILQKFLGQVIREDLKDPKIRVAAERATWLGNDESHYVREWQDKDVADLKRLITLTVHCIESSLILLTLEDDMPAKTKRETR